MFRNPKLEPKLFTNLGKLRDELNDWGFNLMLKLNRYNFYEECYNGCLVRCGDISNSILNKLSFLKVPLYYIDNNSKMIKTLGIEQNQWFMINLKNNLYTKIKMQNNEINTINEFTKAKEYEKVELPEDIKPDFDFYIFYLHVLKKYEKVILSRLKGKGTLILFGFAALFDITWYLTKAHKKKARRTRNETKRRNKIGLTKEKVKSIEEEKKKLLQESKDNRKERINEDVINETIDQKEKEAFLDGKINENPIKT